MAEIIAFPKAEKPIVVPNIVAAHIANNTPRDELLPQAAKSLTRAFTEQEQGVSTFCNPLKLGFFCILRVLQEEGEGV